MNADRPKRKFVRTRLQKIRRRQIYKEKRKWLIEYKRSKGCVDCGEDDPVVLHFDHRNRRSKRFTISKVVNSKSIKSLQKEIRKCDVRCANCHARRSYYLKHNKPP